MQNKANFNKLKIDSTFFVIRSCENKPRLCKPVKQSQTNPISLPPKSGKVGTRHGGLANGVVLEGRPRDGQGRKDCENIHTKTERPLS